MYNHFYLKFFYPNWNWNWIWHTSKGKKIQFRKLKRKAKTSTRCYFCLFWQVFILPKLAIKWNNNYALSQKSDSINKQLFITHFNNFYFYLKWWMNKCQRCRRCCQWRHDIGFFSIFYRIICQRQPSYSTLLIKLCSRLDQILVFLNFLVVIYFKFSTILD